ncbi:glycosyltransferase family 4 protein [Pseudarthrobacter sp. J64]|uniref:glycosyltransferase family 4 protein n=1 Tax=Pseudarthrobacter sp. J64 TaxID=3116485 RepID=UPI002E7FE6DD|nr:glycosyltransferase family 4 protein [Pseudarthrobacter sp. J64]MEE2570800.1 glycosyltransferase family 4 protein [Pseudarthrobacter sp. J64]
MLVGLIAGPWIPVPPETYGGTERVIDGLARGLETAGHSVLLAAPSDSTCPVPLARRMRESDPESLGTAVTELSQVIRAYEALDGVEVIHDHTVTGPLYARRPAGIPVVTTIHGILDAAAVDVYRVMAANTAIIGISHDQVSRTRLPVDRIIHHGMDVESVPVGSGQGGYVCFVGRMCPDKGVLEAIQVARQAGIPLRIAAKMRDRTEMTYFQDVIEPLLGSNEEFLGEVDDAAKQHLMGEAMALLNPIQWHEPFGLVMIEALAAGTPVVGTPIGSAGEIVDHGRTGFLAPTDRLADLLPRAAGLDRALCRSQALQFFSTGRMVRDHLELYRAILDGGLPEGVPDRGELDHNRLKGAARKAPVRTGDPGEDPEEGVLP